MAGKIYSEGGAIRKGDGSAMALLAAKKYTNDVEGYGDEDAFVAANSVVYGEN